MHSLQRVFRYLRSDIGVSPLAFSKVCRVFRHIKCKIDLLKKDSAASADLLSVADAIEAVKLSLLQNCLLPGLALLECNPGIASMVWALLEAYPYSTRYKIYEEWLVGVVQLLDAGSALTAAAVHAERSAATDEAVSEDY